MRGFFKDMSRQLPEIDQGYDGFQQRYGVDVSGKSLIPPTEWLTRIQFLRLTAAIFSGAVLAEVGACGPNIREIPIGVTEGMYKDKEGEKILSYFESQGAGLTRRKAPSVTEDVQIKPLPGSEELPYDSFRIAKLKDKGGTGVDAYLVHAKDGKVYTKLVIWVREANPTGEVVPIVGYEAAVMEVSGQGRTVALKRDADGKGILFGLGQLDVKSGDIRVLEGFRLPDGGWMDTSGDQGFLVNVGGKIVSWDPGAETVYAGGEEGTATPTPTPVPELTKTPTPSFTPVTVEWTATPIPPAATEGPKWGELSPIVKNQAVSADVAGKLLFGGNLTITAEQGQQIHQEFITAWAESKINEEFMKDLLGTDKPTGALLQEYLDAHGGFLPSVSPGGEKLMAIVDNLPGYPRRVEWTQAYPSFPNGFRLDGERVVVYGPNEFKDDLNGVTSFVNSLKGPLSGDMFEARKIGFKLDSEGRPVFVLGSSGHLPNGERSRTQLGGIKEEFDPTRDPRVATGFIRTYFKALQKYDGGKNSCMYALTAECNLSVTEKDLKDQSLLFSAKEIGQ